MNTMRTSQSLFTIFAILIVSIGMAPAFGETDTSLMTVAVDKSFYLDNETIVISGEVETVYSGMPVTMIVKSPSGNIVAIDQITVNAEKKYITEIKSGGALMNTSGIYTVLVHYGQEKHSTTFELETSSPVISGTLTVADSVKSVGYEITGGELLSITPNVESSSLILTLDNTEDGSITLTLPRTIFDAVENGKDSEVFVFVDRNEVNFVESTTTGDRTITILFPEGTQSIEIIGTFVIPEFGTIAMMILAIAVISIIAISAKSRLSIMPRY